LPESHAKIFDVVIKLHAQAYGDTKVATSEAAVIDHPSTSTNNSSLKGSEMSIGDSIIIPRDIRIDEITMSITKNGRKIKNPI
jgi:uncharacterized Zn ribbon protein